MQLSADEPTIFLISGVHTKPKPETNPNPKLRGSFLGMGLGLGLGLVFFINFRFCLSGVLHWAKISLAIPDCFVQYLPMQRLVGRLLFTQYLYTYTY